VAAIKRLLLLAPGLLVELEPHLRATARGLELAHLEGIGPAAMQRLQPEFRPPHALGDVEQAARPLRHRGEVLGDPPPAPIGREMPFGLRRRLGELQRLVVGSTGLGRTGAPGREQGAGQEHLDAQPGRGGAAVAGVLDESSRARPKWAAASKLADARLAARPAST
jgi:hypothetical protein